MKTIAWFIASCGVHAAILSFVLLGSMAVLHPFGLKWVVPAVIGLIATGASGYARQRRWGSHDKAPYLWGLFTAVEAFVVLWIYLNWSLSYPVGAPPPMGEYIRYLFRSGGGELALIVPAAVLVASSWVGMLMALRVRKRTI